jgi:uncharacterized protein (TIGR02679 family)
MKPAPKPPRRKMPSPPDATDAGKRLQRLLGGPELAALRLRLRRVYEQAQGGVDPPVLRLSALAPHETEVLQALAGRAPRPSTSVQLDLQALARSLQAAGLGSSLRSVLEALDGPIAPRAAERAAVASAWAALASEALHPALQPLLATPVGLGLLKRLAGSDPARAGTLCQQAARVLAALPAQGEPRARLAALSLGDAHALDNGRPVATLVLSVLRRAQRNTGEDETDGDESSRALWATQGVSVNELARPALGLNLPLASQAPDGQPRYWSLRQLLRKPPAWAAAQRDVFICENPNLLAIAADALGPRCAPLVCTDGMPAAAQRALLAQLAAAGARLHYHGDFDWPGIAIANRVLNDFGARPWRFGAADYQTAVQTVDREGHAPLRGTAVVAAWDEALTAALQAAHRAIAEEALAELLLPDLVDDGPSR